MPTTATMAIPMPTMDTTTARGMLMLRLPPRLLPLPLLRLRLMPMPTMAPTDMAWPTTATAMVLPTMDTDMVLPIMDTVLDTAMLIPMPTLDTTARGPLRLRPPPLLRLMLMLTTDTMPVLMPTDITPTDMPTVVTKPSSFSIACCACSV